MNVLSLFGQTRLQFFSRSIGSRRKATGSTFKFLTKSLAAVTIMSCLIGINSGLLSAPTPPKAMALAASNEIQTIVGGGPLYPVAATALGQQAAGIGYYNGFTYVSSNCNIYQISTSNDIESIVVGNSGCSYSGDGGPAISAGLGNPSSLTVDSNGDILISDSGSARIRLVAGTTCSSNCPYGLSSITKGYIYTVAGNGTWGYSGDGGPATSAELTRASSFALDSAGDVLFADANNLRIRVVANTSCSSACPYGLTSMTKGYIYTVAGNGTFGNSGDGGPATSAAFYLPTSVALDSSGDMLINDSAAYKIRLVAGTTCSSNCPYGLSSITKGYIYTVAGNGTLGYSGDGGPATSAEFFFPQTAIVNSSGDIIIADSGNNRIRLVAGSSCSSSCPYGLTSMTKGYIYTIVGTGTTGYFGEGVPAMLAELNFPQTVTVDSNNDILIGDNNRIRLVADASCSSNCIFGLGYLAKNYIYTVAGNGTYSYYGNQVPARLALISPGTPTLDSMGDTIIPDSNNLIRLVAGFSCSSNCPYGLSSMTKGYIYTVAGNGTAGYSGDGGPAISAQLDNPTGVTLDSSGDLLIADASNSVVRLIAAASCTSACPYGLTSMTKGYIYTVAGNGTAGYSGDGGSATSAELTFPSGVTLDSAGNLLIADANNNVIRLVAGTTCSSACPYGLTSMTKGYIYTVAGNGTAGYSGDGGPATSAELNSPSGLAVDSTGDILISDYSNNRIREVYVAAPGLYHPITPTRIADTRSSSGNPYQLAGSTFGPGQTQNVTVVNANNDQVPSNAQAVVANVTVTGTTAQGGYLTIWPAGDPQPTTSFINFGPNTTVANLITVQIGTNGQISIYNFNGSTNVIIDIEGYYGPSNSSPEGLFNPLTPTRIADTRSSSGNPYQLAGSTFSPGQTQSVTVLGNGGIPSSGVSSVVLNVTAVNPKGSGDYLTVFPGSNLPTASNINFPPGETIPNTVIVPVSSTGTISIYFFSASANGSADVLVDVEGYYSNSATSSGYQFNPVVPYRVCDTRASQTNSTECKNQTLSSNQTLLIPIAANASGDYLPSMNSSMPPMAIVANITVVNTNSNGGYLTIYPATSSTAPTSSNLNWSAGQTAVNGAQLGLGTNGAINAFNYTGSADVIVDLVGWFD